jgi:hypothetical protein
MPRITIPRVPYDVLVTQEGSSYIAYDRSGNIICRDSNTACIQEGIDFAPPFGRVVAIGDFYISKGIVLDNRNPQRNIAVFGTIYQRGNFDVISIDGYWVGAIERIRIYGGRDYGYSGTGVYIHSADNRGVVLGRVDILGMNGYGIRIEPDTGKFIGRVVINDLDVHDNTGTGIRIAGEVNFLSALSIYSGFNTKNFEISDGYPGVTNRTFPLNINIGLLYLENTPNVPSEISNGQRIFIGVLKGDSCPFRISGGSQIHISVAEIGTVSTVPAVYINAPAVSFDELVPYNPNSNALEVDVNGDVLINSLTMVPGGGGQKISGKAKILKAYWVAKPTVNSGTAVLQANSTRVTVNHGLVNAPTKIIVTPKANVGSFWIENVNSTSFDIVVSATPSSDVEFSWYAEV